MQEFTKSVFTATMKRFRRIIIIFICTALPAGIEGGSLLRVSADIPGVRRQGCDIRPSSRIGRFQQGHRRTVPGDKIQAGIGGPAGLYAGED